ncbi:MAG: hypothetical protein NTV52_00770 [Acidobacteria bacterium]|nr:hypothetical protein [Acidobacteriota bacterium]
MTPKQVFEDSFRMAELLIHVYRLLENDGLQTTGQLVTSLRGLLECEEDEQIQLVVNTIFLGCIRESANVPNAQLRPLSLQNLLRQAVVSGCTAYETYLSTLLAENILTVIEVRQQDFFPTDADVVKYFEGLSLGINEAFRLLNKDDQAVFLRGKIVTFVQKNNLGSVAGLKTVGLLLGIEAPWNSLAVHLHKERRDLTKTVSDAIERRNAIVHKADRDLAADGLEKQPIAFAWTQQAVDTIKHVCLGFDELVNARMTEYRAELAARNQEN